MLTYCQSKNMWCFTSIVVLLGQAHIFVPSTAISPAGPTGKIVHKSPSAISAKILEASHLRRKLTAGTVTNNTSKNENLGNSTIILGNGTDTYTPTYLDEGDADKNGPAVLGNGTHTDAPSFIVEGGSVENESTMLGNGTETYTPSYLDEVDGDENDPIMLGNKTDTYPPSYLDEEGSDKTTGTTNTTANNATIVETEPDTVAAQKQTGDPTKIPAINETVLILDESGSNYFNRTNGTGVEENVTVAITPSTAPTTIFILDNSTDFEPSNETDVVKNETDIVLNETVVSTLAPSPAPTAVFGDYEKDRYENEKGSYGMESEVENGEVVDMKSSLNPVLLGVTLGILLCFSLCTIYVVKMNPDGLCATIVRCLGLVTWSVVSCPFKLCGLCSRKGRDGFDETGGYYNNNDRFVARDLELH